MGTVDKIQNEECEEETRLKEYIDPEKSTYYLKYCYVQSGLYNKHLKNYFEHFEISRYLTLFTNLIGHNC